MARTKQMARKSTWGAIPRFHFATKSAQVAAQKAIAEKASPLAPRNGGSKGDTKVPKKYRSPYQESPLPATCTQDCTEIWKEQPANAEHSCSGSPGGSGVLHG